MSAELALTVSPEDAVALVTRELGTNIKLHPEMDDESWAIFVTTERTITACPGYPTNTLVVDCIYSKGEPAYSLFLVHGDADEGETIDLVFAFDFRDILSAIRRIAAGEQLEPLPVEE